MGRTSSCASIGAPNEVQKHHRQREKCGTRKIRGGQQKTVVPVKKVHVNFYRDTPLYTKVNDSRYNLYKPAGMYVNDLRISEDRMPAALYMRKSDKIQGLQDIQREFNDQLTHSVQKGDFAQVQETLVSVVEETLEEPRTGSLEGLNRTVAILVSDYAREAEITNNLLRVAFRDYSTVVHSIRVMVMAIEYGYYKDLSLDTIRSYGLSALLHDVGKMTIPRHILTAPRRLTDDEFLTMQQHAKQGYDIIATCKFNDPAVARAALEHHERIDGTGYPDGKNAISPIGKIIGIIDCFEALTSDFRPYRDALGPLGALELLKEEVDGGHFDRQLFEDFCYSLVRNNGAFETPQSFGLRPPITGHNSSPTQQ